MEKTKKEENEKIARILKEVYEKNVQEGPISPENVEKTLEKEGYNAKFINNYYKKSDEETYGSKWLIDEWLIQSG
ncbi:MAG: hypothetical protein ACPLZ9_04890, partial [Candidatus Ratteibacteria bacterium]